ncbi:hypothetical protein RF11_06450 [Thelohanellus kitauei]|uniref:Uncharacterized protein n=1 Tax=Thelohanellus kitauei TaxID=669202 RepID=A0A0C2JTA8_THEKT|nr:hypothetical protein RF11_06450 [Thelohanellus kitauei]
MELEIEEEVLPIRQKTSNLDTIFFHILLSSKAIQVIENLSTDVLSDSVVNNIVALLATLSHKSITINGCFVTMGPFITVLLEHGTRPQNFVIRLKPHFWSARFKARMDHLHGISYDKQKRTLTMSCIDRIRGQFTTICFPKVG